MELLTSILVAVVAIEHLLFFYMESFAWTTLGAKVFGKRPEGFYESTKSLISNQGVYNAFLSAGLIWGFFIDAHPWKLYIWIFFLSCVIIAGIWGAMTISKKIFFVQAVPAIIALILIHL